MSPSSIGRDGDIEAFVVDRYLESLLARATIDVAGVPPELEATALRLAGSLPRYHPSFRFEEALAARLAAAADGRTGGELVALPGPALSWPDARPERPGLPRPVVIGGVLTSAALSLAGAAYVAWRRGRADDAMLRAVRAVTRARVA